MEVLHCKVQIQNKSKLSASSSVLDGYMTVDSSSVNAHTLCFDQSYKLVNAKDSSLLEISCTRKIVLLSKVDEQLQVNADRHDIAGYLVVIPNVNKEKVSELSRKMHTVVVEEKEWKKVDLQNDKTIKFLPQDGAHNKGMQY